MKRIAIFLIFSFSAFAAFAQTTAPAPRAPVAEIDRIDGLVPIDTVFFSDTDPDVKVRFESSVSRDLNTNEFIFLFRIVNEGNEPVAFDWGLVDTINARVQRHAVPFVIVEKGETLKFPAVRSKEAPQHFWGTSSVRVHWPHLRSKHGKPEDEWKTIGSAKIEGYLPGADASKNSKSGLKRNGIERIEKVSDTIIEK